MQALLYVLLVAVAIFAVMTSSSLLVVDATPLLHHHGPPKPISSNKKKNNNGFGYSQIAGGFLNANPSFFTVVSPAFSQILQEELHNFTFADQSMEKFFVQIDLTDIHFTSFTCTNCARLALNVKQNSVSFVANQMSGNMYMNYRAKVPILPASTGSCKPSLSNLDMTAAVELDSTAPDAESFVKINVQNFNIGNVALDCDGVAGNIADAIVWVLKHFISSEIGKKVVSEVIAGQVNKYLANATNSLYHFDNTTETNGYFANYNLMPSKSFIRDAQVQLGVKGAIVPAQNPNITFPFPPPPDALRPCPSDSHQASVALSEWSLDTAGYSLFTNGALKASFPKELEAHSVALLIPGFEKKLGPSAPLALSIDATSFPDFAISNASQSLSVAVPMNISLTGAQGTEWILGTLVAGSLSVGTLDGGSKLLFQIESISLQHNKVLETNVGGSGAEIPLIVDLLSKLINDVVVKAVNVFLATSPMPLPSFKGLTPSDVVLQWTEHMICVATNLKTSKNDLKEFVKAVRGTQ